MDDNGIIELLLTLLGGGVSGYGAYRRDARVVGIGAVILALAMLAIHFIGG